MFIFVLFFCTPACAGTRRASRHNIDTVPDQGSFFASRCQLGFRNRDGIDEDTWGCRRDGKLDRVDRLEKYHAKQEQPTRVRMLLLATD